MTKNIRSGKQTRTVEFDTNAVTRANDDVGGFLFTGHAAVFNQRTLIGNKAWGFVEQIDSRAFDEVLSRSDNDTRFLHNHDANQLLARTTNGSLELGKDDEGLTTRAVWPDTAFARDLTTLVEERLITQMSFAFTIEEESWQRLSDDDVQYAGMEMSTITRIGQLFDVSTVTYPAYEGTDAEMVGASFEEALVRSYLDDRRNVNRNEDEAEQRLCEAKQMHEARKHRARV